MTRNSRKMLILAVICAAGCIAAIPGFLLKSRNSNISSVKSALLNPKYVSEVNEVTVAFPENAIVTNADTFMGAITYTFTKETGMQGNVMWTCTTSDGLVFPANSTIMEQLIERAATTVSMAEISDSYSSWSALGLADDTAVNIVFSICGSDGSVNQCSSLYFGGENADGSMIYVRNDRKSTSWRINNNYSSYLTDSIASWTDQRLLPAGSTDETDVTRTCVTVETADSIKKIYNDVDKSAQFDELVHTLLSLRSSELISFADISWLFASENSDIQVEGAPELIMKITLDGDDTSSTPYGLFIYQAEYAGEPMYLAQNFGILNHGETLYFLEISEWTVNKILEAVSF